MENTDDEIWKKASERFPTSTSALLKTFSGDLNQAQSAIVDMLKVIHVQKTFTSFVLVAFLRF